MVVERPSFARRSGLREGGWTPCPAGEGRLAKLAIQPLRIGQELRPIFFESEERPHVKEVNGVVLGGEWVRAAIGAVRGGRIHDVKDPPAGALGSVGPPSG